MRLVGTFALTLVLGSAAMAGGWGMDGTVDDADAALRQIITSENCRTSRNSGFPIKKSCISSQTLTSFVVAGGATVDLAEFSASWKESKAPIHVGLDTMSFLAAMFPDANGLAPWAAVDVMNACDGGKPASKTVGSYLVEAVRDKDTAGFHTCRVTIRRI